MKKQGCRMAVLHKVYTAAQAHRYDSGLNLFQKRFMHLQTLIVL